MSKRRRKRNANDVVSILNNLRKRLNPNFEKCTLKQQVWAFMSVSENECLSTNTTAFFFYRYALTCVRLPHRTRSSLCPKKKANMFKKRRCRSVLHVICMYMHSVFVNVHHPSIRECCALVCQLVVSTTHHSPCCCKKFVLDVEGLRRLQSNNANAKGGMGGFKI